MILIVGSGVAGLIGALTAVEGGAEVTLITPGQLGRNDAPSSPGAGGNTALAQGGIAAALGKDDSPEQHAADTVAVGGGLVDPDAAMQLSVSGAAAIRAMIAEGFAADRAPDGSVAFGLEAAHGHARIVHSGEDHTGAALHRYLVGEVLTQVEAGRIRLLERTTVTSLTGDAAGVTGAMVLTEAPAAAGAESATHVDAVARADGSATAAAPVAVLDAAALDAAALTMPITRELSADAVILATGGFAALFPETSNHAGALGQGIVLGARLGAVVADLEFVQFHPTVLSGTGFLVSESVRGAGAVLRDGAGERFMVSVDERAELAPRDVVSRTVERIMRARGENEVWLDATSIERDSGPGTLARRFPSITAAVRGLGYDWAREPVPVNPAAHYTMGGIVSDLDGRSSVPGLFVAGEVANTGVHGANRLASNSLLEGLVFGARAARAAVAYSTFGRASAWLLRGETARELVFQAETMVDNRPEAGVGVGAPSPEVLAGAAASRGSAPTPGVSTAGAHGAVATEGDEVVRRTAAAQLGIERNDAGLRDAARVLAGQQGMLAELAGMVAASALVRTESRGSHQRADYPDSDPLQAKRRAWKVLRQCGQAGGN